MNIIKEGNVLAVVKNWSRQESDEEYYNRLLSYEYDHEEYPFFNPVEFISNPTGYLEEAIPLRETITTDPDVLHLTMREAPNPVMQCIIAAQGCSYAIMYQSPSFAPIKTYCEQEICLPTHSKQLYFRVEGDNLHYYGVTLSPLRTLAEEGTGGSNEVVLSTNWFPMLVATKSGDNYVAIRPYSHLGLMLFHLEGMPFELHVDLPAEEACLDYWSEAMRYLIINGEINDYTRHFFGDFKAGDDIISYKQGNSTIAKATFYGGDFTYNVYMLNGKVVIMTGESDSRVYVYYTVPHWDWDSSVHGPEDLGFIEAYIGNGTYIYTIYDNTGPISPVPVEVAAAGYSYLEWSSGYPLWDPFGIMVKESLAKYATLIA